MCELDKGQDGMRKFVRLLIKWDLTEKYWSDQC